MGFHAAIVSMKIPVCGQGKGEVFEHFVMLESTLF